MASDSYKTEEDCNTNPQDPCTCHLSSAPEKIFLLLSLTFGIILVFLTAPFQSPDETGHFYRAYQVSTGQLLPVRMDDRLGGHVPSSFIETTDGVFQSVPFHREIKVPLTEIEKRMKIPLNDGDRVFTDFNNTAIMSPVPYLPQAVGIAIARQLNVSPLMCMYAGRIFNLLVWCVITYLAIQAVPVGKAVFCLIALMPMSIFQAASLSQDAFTNGLTLLVTSLFLKVALCRSDASIKWSNLLTMAFLLFLLSLTKFAYSIYLFLFLLIPAARAESKHQYALMFGLLMACTLLPWMTWSMVAKSFYLPYDLYNISYRDTCALIPGVNLAGQLQGVIHSPVQFVIIAIKSILTTSNVHSFIACLGWNDTPFPIWFVVVYVLLMVTVSVSPRNSTPQLNRYKKFILATVATTTVGAIGLLSYLYWTPVGARIVEGIQGRYFIPCAPLFFLLLHGQGRAGSILQHKQRVLRIVLVGALFSLCFTCYEVATRYYVL